MSACSLEPIIDLTAQPHGLETVGGATQIFVPAALEDAFPHAK